MKMRVSKSSSYECIAVLLLNVKLSNVITIEIEIEEIRKPNFFVFNSKFLTLVPCAVYSKKTHIKSLRHY